MTTHPKRFMRDGTATTRRTHNVVPVECDNPYHVTCFEPVTSWAGDPIPRQDNNWHIYADHGGTIHLSGFLVGRESPQFEAGLMRRVARKIAAKEN